jgi:hypothetical protein
VSKQERYDEDTNPFGLPEKRGLHFYLGGYARSVHKRLRPKGAEGRWPWLLKLALVIMALAILRVWFGS